MTPENKLREVRDVLESLIVWMTQSANSPISIAEAEMLLRRLEKTYDS